LEKIGASRGKLGIGAKRRNLRAFSDVGDLKFIMRISNRSGLLPMIIAFVLAFTIINLFFREERNFAELALGEETKPYLAIDSLGYPVHLVNDSSTSRFLLGWQQRGKLDVALFLGNSQTHSINQLKPGEKNYVELLQRNWQPQQLDVLAHTVPNANLQEFYLFFRYWQSKLPIKTILVPIFMDDLREDGIREVFMPQLIREKFQIPDDTSELTLSINKTLSTFRPGAEKTNENDLKALEQTVQESVEKFCNDFLQQHFSSWAYRPNVRGQLLTQLHLLRNTVFGISASTKRKLIPARTKNNYQALEQILTVARDHQIAVVLYLPPIRSDVPIPYDEAEYKQFKAEIKSQAAKYKAVFADFDSIVPGEYWGSKNATTVGGGKTEIDYMHFQYRGHQLLADSLNALLNRTRHDI
jgi:hypothetical protein